MIVPHPQAARKPDIVLVTLGSTRSDRMGFLVQDEDFSEPGQPGWPEHGF